MALWRRYFQTQGEREEQQLDAVREVLRAHGALVDAAGGGDAWNGNGNGGGPVNSQRARTARAEFQRDNYRRRADTAASSTPFPRHGAAGHSPPRPVAQRASTPDEARTLHHPDLRVDSMFLAQ